MSAVDAPAKPDDAERFAWAQTLYAQGDVAQARREAGAAARRGGHRRALTARGRRGDELAQGAVEDGRLEAVEGVADVGEQPQVHAELGERLDRIPPSERTIASS